jgi:hypothetical protein
MKSAALEQVKANLQREAVANDRFMAKGRLAYRMGIERRNNPENSPTARTVWERGWDAAKVEFEARQARWKNL